MMPDPTALASYTAGVLRSRADYLTHHGAGATCPHRRPCRTCAPWLYACPGCGATVTGCHRNGGRCCETCPHRQPETPTKGHPQ